MAETLQEQAAAAVAAELQQVAADPAARLRADTAFERRWAGVEDVRRLAIHTPEGPETAAFEVAERLRYYEAKYASPTLLIAGYDEGVAQEDDEIAILLGGPALLTAEHATNPLRRATGLRESADQGTAALVAAMAVDGIAEGLIMTGRQLGNAGITPDHIIKQTALRRMQARDHKGFLSIHSKYAGQAPSIFDTTEVHGYIGLGKEAPRPHTLSAAEGIMRAAADLGLRVMIGNTTYHPIFAMRSAEERGRSPRERLNEVKLDDAGMPKVSRLGAASPESSTSWMNRMTEDGPLGAAPILQLEISNTLTYTAEDRYTRDPKARAMNLYMGYLLTDAATRIVGDLPRA